MITENIYLLLVVLAAVLSIYTLIDNNNRFYGNIISGLISSTLWYTVSMFSVSGDLKLVFAHYDDVCSQPCVWLEHTIAIQSSPLAYLWGMIGTIMLIMVLLMVVSEVVKKTEEVF